MKLGSACLLFVTILCCLCGPASGRLSESARVDSIEKRFTGSKQDTALVAVLSSISFNCNEQRPKEGLAYAKKALAMARKLNWPRGLALAYNAMGVNEQALANYNSAIDYYTGALHIYESLGNKRGIADMTGNIAGIYYAESNYVKALEYWFDALGQMEALNDSVGVAIQLGNIALIYQEQGSYAKSLEYSYRSLKKCEELGDKESAAMQQGNIANTYDKMGESDKALNAYLKTLAIYEASGNREGIARSLINLSCTYSDRKEHARALECQFRSLEIYKAIGDRDCEGTSYYNLGEFYYAIVRDTGRVAPGRYIPDSKNKCIELATAYLAKAIPLLKESSNLTILAMAYKMQANVQTEVGRYKEALQSYELHTLYKDSVFSIENNRHIADIELRRELALKDKQIELDKLAVAKKRNERYFFAAGLLLLVGAGGILFRNMKLASARELSENKLSAFQARMNPHFIFNSLNSIQSLMLHNEVIPSIKYLNEFSTLMRQILDNSAQSKVRLKTEIDMLQSYIALEQLRYDNFKWAINKAEDLDEAHINIPAMIIQPFVENAIVHGFQPDRKDWELVITFERTEHQVICTVDDNGIGRAKSAELNRERNKNRQSHGINIATSRLALLNNKKKDLQNGAVYIDKTENGLPAGTKVIIKIPIL